MAGITLHVPGSTGVLLRALGQLMMGGGLVYEKTGVGTWNGYHRIWLVHLWASDPLLNIRTGAVDGPSFSDVTFATLNEGDIDFPSCPWK